MIDMHRPEKWGFVQFTKQKPGQAKFVPDPSAPARAVLQEIYYAQKDFQKANKKWGASLAKLKLANGLGSNIAKPPSLQATPDGYRATAGIKLRDGRLQLWHIRQDTKVWSE